jgi:hypothetical protein
MTFMFLMIILGATDSRAPAGFAPIAIGLALTLIHLISIPVTNTSVNPARSTGPAIWVGGWALGQLWLFWVAPILGAILAGLAYRGLAAETKPLAVGLGMLPTNTVIMAGGARHATILRRRLLAQGQMALLVWVRPWSNP